MPFLLLALKKRGNIWDYCYSEIRGDHQPRRNTNHSSEDGLRLDSHRMLISILQDVTSVLHFLHDMHLNGCLCSGLFVALSALSSVINIQDYPKLLDYTLVLRFLKKSTTDILL